jgi:hypothetical protein
VEEKSKKERAGLFTGGNLDVVAMMAEVGIPSGSSFYCDLACGTRVSLACCPLGVAFRCEGATVDEKLIYAAWIIWVLSAFGQVQELGAFSSPIASAEMRQVIEFMDSLRSLDYRNMPAAEVLRRFKNRMTEFWKWFVPEGQAASANAGG